MFCLLRRTFSGYLNFKIRKYKLLMSEATHILIKHVLLLVNGKGRSTNTVQPQWINIKVITEWWHPPTVFVHFLVWFGLVLGSYKKLIAVRGWLFYPLINWLQFSTIHTKFTLTTRFGKHQMRIMDLDKLNLVQIRDCSLVSSTLKA